MSAALGLGACAVSSVCFGSMYVAVRKFDSGDAIWTVGLIMYAATGFPQFQPLAMLGGFLWCIGNLTALPIIKILGLGMGILIWGTVNCVVGWAAGRFGLFGINPSVPNSPLLNYAGLVGILFSLVRTTVPNVRKKVTETVTVENETSSLMPQTNVTSTTTTTVKDEVTTSANAQPSSALKLKLMAIGFSMLAGVCYGLTFVPVIYIQDNPETFKNPPKEAIYYAFSHFSGILVTSTVVLLGYLLKIILPSFFAGLLWAIAQLAWFLANDLLSQAITFPINAMMPGVCAALWSVFYFKEITGAKNLSSSVLSYSPNCFVELGRFGFEAVDSKAEKGSKVCRLFDELLSCEARTALSTSLQLPTKSMTSRLRPLNTTKSVLPKASGRLVHEVHPIGDAGIMLISTIDGYITAIDAETGRDKWRFKEAPILESPISIQQGFTFIPNPRDGQLYLVVEGRLSKLPFTIPQLVKVSPCRSNDGILYAGNKKDVWMAINPETGERTETFSSPTSNSYCPVSDPNTVFIGKTEYHLSMMDTKKRDRQWNATFVDYSSHLLPAESQYPFQHFTSSADGSLLTVDGLTGEVLWERQFNTVIVNMYLLKEDGMHKLPSTAIGKETFDALIGVGSFTNFEKIMALLLHGKYKRQKW
uniref:Transmembrane protein 144 n=1 Tax=Ditylenchus dipsaci TaxID=166011 RepID=A0A915CV77_9BILA